MQKMVEILFNVTQSADSITRVGTGSVLHCTFIDLKLVYSKLSQSQRCVVTHKTICQKQVL